MLIPVVSDVVYLKPPPFSGINLVRRLTSFCCGRVISVSGMIFCSHAFHLHQLFGIIPALLDLTRAYSNPRAIRMKNESLPMWVLAVLVLGELQLIDAQQLSFGQLYHDVRFTPSSYSHAYTSQVGDRSLSDVLGRGSLNRKKTARSRLASPVSRLSTKRPGSGVQSMR